MKVLGCVLRHACMIVLPVTGDLDGFRLPATMCIERNRLRIVSGTRFELSG